MLLYRFKLLIIPFLMLAGNVKAEEDRSGIFSAESCLESAFSLNVSHKAAPFGMSETKLELTKDKCLITIEHERLWFLKNKWDIDICREPVHVKSGARTVSVIQRELSCDGHSDTYCREISHLLKVLQDDGLIFAPGERETLDSDHGRVYCAYLLLDQYLNEANVFSRHGFEGSLFPERRRERSRERSRERRRSERYEEREKRSDERREEREQQDDLPSATRSF